MKQSLCLKKTLRLALASLVLGMGSVSPALAGTAQLTLSPTRIVLEGSEHYATITVKNSGTGIGRYRIELVDATMQENGGIKMLPDGQRDPFSAQDMLSVAPRSMTLKPDDFQTIRLLVKNPEGLKDGEYRSHLKVKMTETDLNEKTDKPNAEAAGIAIKPKLSLVIPIIVRRGKTTYNVTITDEKLLPPVQPNDKPQMQISFALKGNRSIIGDIKVAQVSAGGKETQLTFFPGVAIYRGTEKRDLVIPLDVPAGTNLQGSKIVASYLTQAKDGKDGGVVMAVREFTP